MPLPECPRCGYSRLPMSNDSMLSHQEIVYTLQTELRSIENAISRLSQARLATLHKLNNVRPSTRNLPAEVLATIFQFSRPPIDFNEHYLDLEDSDNTFHAQERFLYVLAAVSRSWREVALSTPRLWTNVSLNIDVGFGSSSVQKNLSLLNLHIQRSRNIPMSIELVFEEFPEYEPGSFGYDSSDGEVPEEEIRWEANREREEYIELLEPLQAAVFVDQASTIHDLLLIRPPYEWFQFITETLSECRSVTVFHPQPTVYDDSETLDLTDLPRLQRVQLIDCSERKLSLDIPSSINTLHLRKLPLAKCIQLLSRCRNLVEFEVVEFTDHTIGEPLLNETVVFPYLEHFGWSLSSYKARAEILGLIPSIQLPRLRSLVWSDDRETHKYHTPRDLRPFFFSHLPSSLSSLTFVRMFIDPGEHIIERLLNCVPQISELHFIDCTEATIQTAIKAIGRPFSTSGPDGLTAIILPNIRKMSIISQGRLERLSLTEIIYMFEALHEKGGGKKRFQLEVEAIWKEDEKELRRLMELVPGGFELEGV